MSGPAPVTFATPNAATSQAHFTAPGAYVLQLSVNDGVNTASGQAMVAVYLPSTTQFPSPIISLSPASSGPNAVNGTVQLQAQFLYSSTQISNFQFGP